MSYYVNKAGNTDPLILSDWGEGLTFQSNNPDLYISGKPTNNSIFSKNGYIMKYTAADILMHELLVHAIPNLLKQMDGYGRSENISRRQIEIPERDFTKVFMNGQIELDFQHSENPWEYE